MEATATAQAQAAPPPRLRERYEQEVLPALTRKFGYSTPMQAPRVEKITLNMGVGEAKQDAKMLEAAQSQLAFHYLAGLPPLERPDIVMAHAWYERAAANGQPGAAALKDRIGSEMSAGQLQKAPSLQVMEERVSCQPDQPARSEQPQRNAP